MTMTGHGLHLVLTIVSSIFFSSVCAQFMYAYETPSTPPIQPRVPYGISAAGQPAQAKIFAGRQQRSLYPGGWQSDYGGFLGYGHGGPVGLNHITKEELIALVEAWKEVEQNQPPKKPEPDPEPEEQKPEPEPEPEAEPEPEEEPEPEQQPEVAPEAPAPPAPPAGVPLTVSLPAFVPIQLSAMYTAPAPVGGPGAGIGVQPIQFAPTVGVNNEAAGEGGGNAEAAGDQARSLYRSMYPRTIKQNAFGRTLARPRLSERQNAFKQTKYRPAAAKTAQLSRLSKATSIRFPIDNPRNFASANYVVSKPSTISQRDLSSSPDFLANAPGPVQLVPSSQLLSNLH